MISKSPWTKLGGIGTGANRSEVPLIGTTPIQPVRVSRVLHRGEVTVEAELTEQVEEVLHGSLRRRRWGPARRSRPGPDPKQGLASRRGGHAEPPPLHIHFHEGDSLDPAFGDVVVQNEVRYRVALTRNETVGRGVIWLVQVRSTLNITSEADRHEICSPLYSRAVLRSSRGMSCRFASNR